MATSGLLMATPRGLPPACFWTVDGNSGLPTRESPRMLGTLPGRVLPIFADVYRFLPTFLGDFSHDDDDDDDYEFYYYHYHWYY